MRYKSKAKNNALCTNCGWYGDMLVLGKLERAAIAAQHDIPLTDFSCPDCSEEVDLIEARTSVIYLWNIWRKINHIRMRTYILLFLTVVALCSIEAGLLSEILSYSFVFGDEAITLTNYPSTYEMGISLGILFLFFVFGFGIQAWMRFLCRIFAPTYKDIHRYTGCKNYEQIALFYAPKSTPNGRAEFLREYNHRELIVPRYFSSRWFKLTSPDGLDLNDYGDIGRPIDDFRMGINANIFWIIAFVYWFNVDYGIMLFDYFLVYVFAITPVVKGAVSHVLVSFQDVRTLETKDHADRLTNEYIGLIQKYEESDGHEEE